MSQRATLEVVVPVRNEQRTLARQIQALRTALDGDFHGRPQVGIAVCVNGSTDGTLRAARRLAESVPGVRVAESAVAGKGAAVRHGWLTSTAEIVAYTDLDLSADIHRLPALVTLIEHGVCDIAVGSRLMPASRMQRSWRRQLPGLAWAGVAGLLTRPPVRDTACGLKAARRECVVPLLSAGREDQWAFDLELLVLAQRKGLRACELAVTWVEDPASALRLRQAVPEMLKAAWRLRTTSRPPLDRR